MSFMFSLKSLNDDHWWNAEYLSQISLCFHLKIWTGTTERIKLRTYSRRNSWTSGVETLWQNCPEEEEDRKETMALRNSETKLCRTEKFQKYHKNSFKYVFKEKQLNIENRDTLAKLSRSGGKQKRDTLAFKAERQNCVGLRIFTNFTKKLLNYARLKRNQLNIGNRLE